MRSIAPNAMLRKTIQKMTSCRVADVESLNSFHLSAIRGCLLSLLSKDWALLVPESVIREAVESVAPERHLVAEDKVDISKNCSPLPAHDPRNSMVRIHGASCRSTR